MMRLKSSGTGSSTTPQPRVGRTPRLRPGQTGLNMATKRRVGLAERGAHQRLAPLLKNSTVFLMPWSKPTLGSQPSSFLAKA